VALEEWEFGFAVDLPDLVSVSLVRRNERAERHNATVGEQLCGLSDTPDVLSPVCKEVGGRTGGSVLSQLGPIVHFVSPDFP
jgi:hypothetical protein